MFALEEKARAERFRFSLFENITLGKLVDTQLLKEVVEGCLINEFAPDPSVLVGGKNVNLSSGQERRIRIARGLMQGADIFFDEAFTGLDFEKKENYLIFLMNFSPKRRSPLSHTHEDFCIVRDLYKIEDLICKTESALNN